jgi:hypothetical protein
MQSAAAPGEVLITPTVYEKVQNVDDFVIRQKASGVEFKGKTKTLDLYEVLWRESNRDSTQPAPKPSRRALDMATGLHVGLLDTVEQILSLEAQSADSPPAQPPQRPAPMAPADPVGPVALAGSSGSSGPSGMEATTPALVRPKVLDFHPELETQPAWPRVPQPETEERPSVSWNDFSANETQSFEFPIGPLTPPPPPEPVAPAPPRLPAQPLGMRFVLLDCAEGSPEGLQKRWFLDGSGANEMASADHGGVPFGQPGFTQIGFTQVGDAVLVEDLGFSGDIFLRVDQPQRLKAGDLLLMGRQRFRFEKVAAPEGAENAAPESHDPSTLPSPAPPAGRLVLLNSEGLEEGSCLLQGVESIVGRRQGYSYPDDDTMSDVHARIYARGKEFIIEDQGSVTGTFLRLRKRALLRSGETLLVGNRRLKVFDQELP